ncbi:cytochrome P450 [Thalassobaculum fulvum]|uniref:Cytochrome P450 n=1 Tax=Thalassobaculum fulvum TaxID=1633335 RepID=A0A919CQ19_9PROT|nr:cytochrome P450 [Thalassobaculum fulvum]GHD52800.1 cytochrome P450 [Thalassobaculum fulvum]
MDTGTISGFDLMDPAVHADPYPTYRWLRDNAPVYRVPGAPLWVVSRYADVERILHDHQTFSSDLGMKVPLMSMVMKDPPDHTRLRQTVNRAFTPRNIQHLAPRIEAIAEDLASGLAGPCEFVQAFANPLPVTVICEMLGVPLKQRARMNRYARDALLASFAATGMGSAELRAEAEAGLAALMAILDEAIALHRATPKDNIISALVAEEARGVVDRAELRHLCALLLIAGHETTANLLANGAHILARDPDLFARLKADPALIPAFVEEMARMKPPLQRLMRRTTRAVEVAGTTIPADVSVMLLPGSANRDTEAWDVPDDLDLDRDNRRHLGFGTGIHVCPGASLTRLEARIAFEVLLKRTAAIEPAPDRPPSPIVGYGAGSLGWNQLPLIVRPA